MPAINKESFLADISKAKPYGDGSQGTPNGEPEESGSMTCGEQLKAAIDSGDTVAIDDALREAVMKYSSGG